MKKILIAAVVSVALLSGCANTAQYDAYVKAQETVALARAQENAAKYMALAQIAIHGNEGAKVAAVMSINQGNNQSVPQSSIMLPKSGSDTALQWASVLVPSLTQLGLAVKNADVMMNQSNNNASVARSTNETMLGIASKIQAPGTTYNNSYNTDNTHVPTVVNPVVVNPEVVNPIVIQNPPVQ